MSVLEWFKALWPVAMVLAAFGVRLEVGQALNKQRMRSTEKDVAGLEKASEKAIEALHARISRHESETGKYLSEIRNDIKTLLSRQ